MSFYPGQKVVCVPDKLKAGRCLLMAEGKVFTIRAVYRCCSRTALRITIDGRSTSCSTCGKEYGGEYYDSRHFRPIDDLTASLAQTEFNRIVEERPDLIQIPQYA